MPNLKNNDNTACVFAENDGAGVGVFGFSTGSGDPIVDVGYGVVGVLGADPQLYPFAMYGAAVIGFSNVKEGVVGVSSAQAGVLGIASGAHAGVSGQCAPFAANARCPGK